MAQHTRPPCTHDPRKRGFYMYAIKTYVASTQTSLTSVSFRPVSIQFSHLDHLTRGPSHLASPKCPCFRRRLGAESRGAGRAPGRQGHRHERSRAAPGRGIPRYKHHRTRTGSSSARAPLAVGIELARACGGRV